jgi:hypothetical protein
LAGGQIDPDVVVAVLQAEFPWLEALAARVRESRGLRRYAGAAWLKLPPMLLAGPPGTDKSRAVRRLAELSGTAYAEISATGSDDARHLKGTARGRASTQPAAPIVTIHEKRVANPIILVDAIDKASTCSRKGRLVHALLSLLEPDNARHFFDEALLAHCDLSQVSWVAAANTPQSLPAPLLSRLSIIHAMSPGRSHLPAILRGLRESLAAELGVRPDDLPPLTPAAEAALGDALARSGDLRAVRRAYERAIAVSARQIARVRTPAAFIDHLNFRLGSSSTGKATSGSCHFAPIGLKSATSWVSTVKPLIAAVAAMHASSKPVFIRRCFSCLFNGRTSPAAARFFSAACASLAMAMNSPVRHAVCRSTPRMRSAYTSRTSDDQSLSIWARRVAPLTSRFLMPAFISAIVTTLMKISLA